MKSRICSTVLSVSISLALLLGTASVSYSEYTVTQITDNDYQDVYFGAMPPLHTPGRVMNDNGQVVWTSSDDSGAQQILFWDGLFPPEDHITQVTNNNYGGAYPSINNNGYVVWRAQMGPDEDPEIFLWDGQFPPEDHITQISNNSFDDTEPLISDNGYVVWGTTGSSWNIFVHDGITTTQLTENGGADHQINDSGQVVWVGNNWEIFFWDGQFPPEEHIAQIPGTAFTFYAPLQMNDSGQVVWQEGAGYDSEIFFWDGQFPPEDHITQITNNTYGDEFPQINDNGQVVWVANHSEIFLWDGEFPAEDHTIQIPEASFVEVGEPQINNDGHIVWTGTNDSFSILEILLYDGITTRQLTTNGGFPLISNNGHVVWIGFGGNDSELFVATPSSCIDVDEDGVCDDQDNCPDVYNPEPQSDLDGDGLGDECDDDDDGDGLLDTEDNCPITANPDQDDSDYDGAGDACDSHFNNDTVVDAIGEEATEATGVIVEMPSLPGGNGMIAKLNEVIDMVALAVTSYGSGELDLSGYLSALDDALLKLDDFDNQLEAKSRPSGNKPPQIPEDEANELRDYSGTIRQMIEDLKSAAI